MEHKSKMVNKEEKKSVAIVIPCYKNRLSQSEQVSLKACIHHLASFDTYFVSPNSLDLTNILAEYPLIKIERFDDRFFSSQRAYNELVLDESFYLRFINYDYILIYQLDAIVFKNELQMWVDKGYDYIGAPWVSRKYSKGKTKRMSCYLLQYYHTLTKNIRKKRGYWCYNKVGNGGLSLRKVEKMIYITHKYKEQIKNSKLECKDHIYPEDIWLAWELRKRDTLFMPHWKEALKFAVERDPEFAHRLNGNELPFGCHAFNRPPYIHFWSKHINGI